MRRAAARAGRTSLLRAERIVGEVDTIRVDADCFDRAGRIEPLNLRSLDVLHIAAALSLAHDLAGVVAYDERLLAAASDLGIKTASPGA